jgi:hypothetical protein
VAKRREPHHPAPYETADIYAIQALARGEANKGQQLRALEWILDDVCGIRREQFHPESERVTDYLLGRRNVGLQIARLMQLRPKQTARTTAEGIPIANEPKD